MADLDARVAAFEAAPAGIGFLLVVEEAGLAPEVAAQPEMSVTIAALVQCELSPWRMDHDWRVNAVLAEGPRLTNLARAILTREEAAWWFEPLDRRAQRWISPDGGAPDPGKLVTPTGRLSHWERYAQKPDGGFFTSTAGKTTSWLAALEYVGEHPMSFPLVQYELEVSPDARIFELDGPAAWHRLCTRYPCKGKHGQLVPDWPQVAREWDAVHLTLGGLLTSEQVRVESPPAGWSEHRFWEAEQTVWLRWCFTNFTRLADLSAFPRHPSHLQWPSSFFQNAILDTIEQHTLRRHRNVRPPRE